MENKDTITKVKNILKIINEILEKIEFNLYNEEYGLLRSVKIEEIIKKEKILNEVDNEDILLKEYKIYYDDFNNLEKYYSKLFYILLKKINDFVGENIILFKKFNQSYFYCKFIKYLINLIEINQECISDDIIKVKIYEIIKCLNADDKLYYQNFYFFISILHLDNIYNKKNESIIPKFEVFKNINFEKYNIINIINQILAEKRIILQNISVKIKDDFKDKNNILFNYFINMINENCEHIYSDELNKQFMNINNKSFAPKFLTKSENDLYKFLNENKLIEEYNKLINSLKEDLKKKYEFYYLGGINKFVSLDIEHIYVIINSLISSYNINFSDYVSNYINQLNSYIEGVKTGQNLYLKIKRIIEDKNFYELIYKIYNCNKMKEYIRNPIQYSLNTNYGRVEKYYEKFEEYEYEYENINMKDKIKTLDKKVSKFTIKNDIAFDEKEERTNNNKNIKDIKEIKENTKIDNNNLNKEKCQLEKDYEYFMNNIFDSDFFKNRIIYSFLPIGIKGFVEELPKIIINIAGNSILTYILDENSEEFNMIIKALCVIVIVHEIIHLIRRQNKDYKKNTPIGKNGENYEGGKSLIYHFFGDFLVECIDLDFAKVILDEKSWESDILKEKLFKLGNITSEREKYVQKFGGIRFYDSTLNDSFDDNGNKNIDEDDIF